MKYTLNRKTISYFICFVIITIVSASCSDNKTNDFDYGHIEDGMYFNNYFNCSISLPRGWVVQSKEQTQKIVDLGKDLVAGDDENMKAVIKASEVNTANLLAVFQYELGAAVEFNPNIMIIAENVKHATGIKNGSDYLFQSRRILEQSQFKYDYLSEEFEKETIGQKEFYKMYANLNYMKLEIKQVYYSTIINGFSFNLIISYVSDEQKNELTDSINSLNFNI